MSRIRKAPIFGGFKSAISIRQFPLKNIVGRHYNDKKDYRKYI